MVWKSPIQLDLIATSQSESFRAMGPNETGLPLHPHPGSFGFQRAHHCHEGIDLYAPEGSRVYAVEDGEVITVIPFTGAHADPPTSWWNDTWAVMIRGKTGVVNYGEIIPSVALGDIVSAGDLIGTVTPVLTKDKGRPMSMLHLELYDQFVREPVEWQPYKERPSGLHRTFCLS